MTTTKTSSPTSLSLRPYQEDAVEQLQNGNILLGGVGAGKTITGLAYFFRKVCGGSIEDGLVPTTPKDLYVITTARKRDSLDWEREAAHFSISTDRESSIAGIQLTVDSWNNISKYTDVKDAFFIFDEQKVVGYGAWAKAFIKITKANNWILLSATPGDTWMDYIAVFIANGFYKNKTAFVREHVIYNSYVHFPLVDRYVGEDKLKRLREQVLVRMKFKRKTVRHNIDIVVPYDHKTLEMVIKERWNIYKDEPILNSSEFGYTMRKVVNSHPSRLDVIRDLSVKHSKLIVFYNFDYELDILRQLDDSDEYEVAEYNGHIHQEIPRSDKWIYLTQYLSSAEAWNCTETNAIAFYSLNYSYRLTTQAAGRIDRMNTPYQNLYYYFIQSESTIDRGVVQSLKQKTDFNERKFFRDQKIYF